MVWPMHNNRTAVVPTERVHDVAGRTVRNRLTGFGNHDELIRSGGRYGITVTPE